MRMRLPKLLSIRGVAFVIGALIVSAVAYGFAASNIVPETGAGDGEEAISGYDITDVSYQLGATDPTTIESVSFNLAPTAGAQMPTDVQVQLFDGGDWYSCSVADPGPPAEYTCALTPAVNVADADQLRVVAAQ